MSLPFAELLSYPFMQRALLSALMLGLLLPALGVYVNLRRMAFFGDGIAHSSLAGIAIALLFGFAPLPVALLWAVLVALFIFWLERSTRLSSDTLIGILFTASLALGVVLISFTHGYQPDLVSYMFGSILAVKAEDLIVIAAVAVPVLAWLFARRRELAYMSLSEENAAVSGIKTERETLLLYVALALATVLGVKILGVILVSAILIIPPATSRLLTSTFRDYTIWSVIVGEIAMILGLVISFYFDLPSGATIVLLATAMFALCVAFRKR